MYPLPHTGITSPISNIPHQNGTLIIFGEPALIHHYPPKSGSLLVWVSTNVKWCTTTIIGSEGRISLWSPTNPLFHLFSHSPLATFDLFIISIVSRFLEYQSYSWYCSHFRLVCLLSNMRFGFLHVFSWLDSSCLGVLQFIYPLTSWRLSWLLSSIDNYE